MRAAPPVAVRCAPGWAWRGLQSSLPALAGGVLLYWAARRFELLPPAVALVSALSAAAAVGALAWWRSQGSVQALQWDGRQWTLDGRPGSLRLMADIGPALLLRHGSGHWLMPTRTQAGGAWHGLRTAVVAHGRGSVADGID